MKKILLVLMLGLFVACDDNKPANKESETPLENTAEITKNTDTTLYDNLSIEEKNYALMESSENGDLEKVKALIKSGSDFNTENDDANTPLNVASHEGNLEVVKYLVERGAHTNNMNIVDWASAGWVEKVKESILNDGNIHIDIALSWGASRNGHIEVIKYLIENGADINAETGGDGSTPVIYALRNGHIEVVTYLIENGANINIQNEYKDTALAIASIEGYIEMVKLLVENGADINLQDYNSGTPLVYASKNRYIEIVKYLMESGADINIKDNDGKTALRYASENEHTEIAKLLIDAGAK